MRARLANSTGLLIVVAFLCATLAAPLALAQYANDAARIQLEQQLKAIEQQIAQYQQDLVTLKGQKNTLMNKIAQLKKQQAALTLQIQATNLRLNTVTTQLGKTQSVVQENEDQLSILQKQLATYVRLAAQQDSRPFLYTLLRGGSLADVFTDVTSYVQVTDSLHDTLGKVQQVKQYLDQQATILGDQQDENRNLLSLKLLQQDQLKGTVTEQNTLLTQTKGKESNYQQQLKDSQKLAADIRSRIYQLLGVSTQITFGQALQIATWVSQQINVRPAYLLAVLTQESNLGKNVGTCNRSGDPPSKSWRTIMKPDRDQQPFRTITGELGMNPDVTPVSCPMRDKNGNQVGWGGAMGPAQFIPSTWLGYRAKVTAFTGKSTANPWDIRDAFVAAAIYLKGAGADGTTQGERNAALRYFSGSTNPQYAFYADSVAALAQKYQNDINTLNK